MPGPAPLALGLGLVCPVIVAGAAPAEYPQADIAVVVGPTVFDVLSVTASVDENSRAR
jgi:hypothetical protein